MTNNQHIGRKQSLGMGKEGSSTPGTSAAATVWVPKISGKFAPENTVAEDTGAYGVIDEVRDIQTVKTIVTVNAEADVRDVFIGHFFQALYGASYPCVKFPIPGSVTGTYVEGETITETTSNATGTLRRADTGGSSKALYIDPTGGSGTFTGGRILTGGTSGATSTGGTIESPSSVRWHLFRLANSNTHPTYTMYVNDPVSTMKSTYCMLDTFDLEVTAGQFANFKSVWKGQKIQSGSGTPSFTAQNPFLAKYANLYVASAFTGLDAASPTVIKSMKLSFKKNVTDYMQWGQTDVQGYWNRQFRVEGTFTLLYNEDTYRDLVTNSTKQAFRVKLANTDVTLGSSSNPTIQFDFPVMASKSWTITDSNNNLVEQTLSIVGQYDLTTSLTSQCLLANSQTTAF